MERRTVLVVGRDHEEGERLGGGLNPLGFTALCTPDPEQALAWALGRSVHTVVSSLTVNEQKQGGLRLCERLLKQVPNLPVIICADERDVDSAIAAMRAGAYDFFDKSADITALAHAIERAADHKQLSDEVKRLHEQAGSHRGAGELLGTSASMRRVYDLIHRVSDTDVSVVITGESGTGKELVAKALHTESHRSEAPFVPVNCAAVPANLIESELFGHVQGAFTGARSDREGLFRQAHGGTIFLDEIGELHLEMQPKLLRVLQERRLRPVGGAEEVDFDARVVSATNVDFETEIKEGRFREDLFYRLHVVRIHMPPLRSRGNDVLVLAQHFVEQYAERFGKNVYGITEDAARALLAHDWPGNVRQLENAIERAVTLTRFDQLTVDDFSANAAAEQKPAWQTVHDDADQLPTLQRLEDRYIEHVLKVADGNKTQAAKVLGLDRRTLYRKLERIHASDDPSD